MIFDEYKIITGLIESGIDYGWRRAHKHCDKPDEDTIKTAIYDAIVGEMCEIITFEPKIED